jgi:predicted RNase H-like HicB family nuclease
MGVIGRGRRRREAGEPPNIHAICRKSPARVRSKYEASRHEPDETGTIVAECPAIPGCVSQGRTEAEALENIREAIVGCLAAREANHMPLTIAVREVEVSD